MTIIREINTLMSKARSKYYSNYSDEFSTLIENPKFIDLLKDSSISIKAALDHTGLLFRGLINLVDDDNRIGYTQPKTRTDLRNPKAATYEMMNLYENLDFFQNWPDRYRGIFMTNSKENAYKFSDTIGLVFPRNGANIGRTKGDFNDVANPLRRIAKSLEYWSEEIEYKFDEKRIDGVQSLNRIFYDSIFEAIEKYKISNNPLYRNEFLVNLAAYLEIEPKEFEEYSNRVITKNMKYIPFLPYFVKNFIPKIVSNKLDLAQTINVAATRYLKLTKDFYRFNMDEENIKKIYRTGRVYEYWTDDPCLVFEYKYFRDLFYIGKAVDNNKEKLINILG